MIVRELSLVDMRTDASKALALDDPELFEDPIAFEREPGLEPNSGKLRGP